MQQSIIGNMRIASIFKKTTATLITLFYLFAFYSPSAMAVNEGVKQQFKTQQQQVKQTYADKLQHLKEKLRNREKILTGKPVEGTAWARFKSFFGVKRKIQSQGLDEIFQIKNDISQQHQQAMQKFKSIENHINKHNLSDIILQRHQDAIQKYKTKHESLMDNLTGLNQAETLDDQGKAFDQLDSFLQTQQFKLGHQALNPDQMPFGPRKNKARKPKITKKDLQAVLGIENNTQIAQTARLGFPTLMTGAEIPAEYLAETIDVKITPEIEALAAELNHQPVEIYTWVHNNIQFIPSYGSIQGADYTLQTKRGNAFDTASLLIALLRASNIPARYAYGTVEILADKVNNWVGGVNKVEAALQLLGQGGIPTTAITEGGKITRVQIEHTWVEAFIDYFPSKGMVNRFGDYWVPMDASFKQYDFTQGMDIQNKVAFDAETFVNDILNDAQYDENDGSWISGLPEDKIKAKFEEYKVQVEDYVKNQNPEATVGDVLGISNIKIIEPRPLAAGLPYRTIATSERFANIPDNMRVKFKYELKNKNDTVFNFEKPTVELAGKKLALSFSPATPEDLDVLNSYLPKPHDDGTPIEPSELPTSLPGYLINVKAEFTIDGNSEFEGGSFAMGTELNNTMGFWDPTLQWTTSNNKPIAGEYHAIGIDLHGLSPKQVEVFKAKLEVTKTKLENSELDGLSKHNVTGDILYTTILSYFALNDLKDIASSRSADIVQYRYPSYGVFQTKLQSDYWYGAPQSVTFPGLQMDVDLSQSITANKEASNNKWRNYNQMTGARMSMMEHSIPEQLFSTKENKVEAISAVKALTIAMQQGQKIYQIKNENINSLQNLNISQSIKDEIKNAILSGKEATVSESNIDFNGWNGVGYIIIDPSTGAGAYKISGGSNGSILYYLEYGLLYFLKALVLLGQGALSILVGILVVMLAEILSTVVIGIAALTEIGTLLTAVSGASSYLYFAAGVFFDSMTMMGWGAAMITASATGGTASIGSILTQLVFLLISTIGIERIIKHRYR